MSLVPSLEDLQEAPLRTLIGYAARCAQRVQPMFLAESEHAKAKSSIKSVQKAIDTAMKFAANEKLTASAVSKAEDQVTQAIEIASENGKKDKASILAGNAAYAAVNATHLAILSIDADDPEAEALQAVKAVRVAAESAAAADSSAAHAAGMDWVMLSRMDLGQFPMFGEPIDASGEGPLGPLVANFQMERNRLQAEQAQIDVAREQMGPDLTALRDEHEKLLAEMDELRASEKERQEKVSQSEEQFAHLNEEKTQLRNLAVELKDLLVAYK